MLLYLFALIYLSRGFMIQTEISFTKVFLLISGLVISTFLKRCCNKGCVGTELLLPDQSVQLEAASTLLLE